MKRIKKYNGEENSFVDEEGRSIKSEESSEPLTPAQMIEFSESTKSLSKAAPKQRIVSKKELEESGLSIRDFLNRERGLTRREEPKTKPATKSPEPVKKIESASAPMARSIKSDIDELAKSRASMGGVNMLPSGRMSPEKKEEVIKPTPKRSNYTVPKASEFTGMGGMKFAKGGSVSSASKRADGCAVKGKTKGRFV